MAPRKQNILLWFSSLALILACIPTLGTPAPTVDPAKINLFIAQTANAAASQTAAAMPTSTPTETPTSTPGTSTPSPTYTLTFIFRLSTLTSTALPTFTAEGDSSQNLACQVIGVEPVYGTELEPNKEFDAIWRVTNIGKKLWKRDDVDYLYKDGAKLHKVDSYNINGRVKTGETISIVAAMKTPETAGFYTTNWTLRSGVKEFCKLPLTIIVK